MKLWWINVLINEIIVGNVSICEIEEEKSLWVLLRRGFGQEKENEWKCKINN